MFFLLRTTFWITLVLVLIPLGSDRDDSHFESVDPVAAYFAAHAAVADMGGFCTRNPGACKTGGEALTAIGAQARDGARIVYEFLDDQVTEPNETDVPSVVAIESVDAPLTTGSTSASPVFDAYKTNGGPAVSVADRPEVAPEPEALLGAVPRPNPRSRHRT